MGDGASNFAKERGLKMIENSSLISEKALKKYQKYKKRLDISRKLMSSGPKLSQGPNTTQVTITNVPWREIKFSIN